MNRLIRCE